MGISLNNLPGAVDVSQEDNNDDDTSLYVGNPYIEKKMGIPQEINIDKSISENVEIGVEKTQGLIGSVIDAATGEGANIEFPELPESTSIEDIGFFETLVPNAKLMFVRDDWGKAEVIKNSFEGDKRFGGIKYDKFKNPMVEWNNNFYYINKPGISTQDFGTVGGDLIKYLPASKMVSAQKSIPGKIVTGVTGYSATDLVSQALENIISPITEKSKNKTKGDIAEEALTMGAISTGMDLALPGIAKVATGSVKAGVRGGANLLNKEIPNWAQPIVKSKSKYPLTQGQAQSSAPYNKEKVPMSERLANEDMLRNTPGLSTEQAKGVITRFDETQLNAIKDDAVKLQNEFGSGNIVNQADNLSADIVTTSAQDIKSIVTNEAGLLKKIASEGYDLVKNAPNQPIVTIKGINTLKTNTLNVIKEDGVTPFEMNRMPLLKELLNDIKSLGSNKVKLNFKTLIGLQKSANRSLRDAEKSEQMLIGEVKRQLDEFVFDGIETGLIQGNKEVINTLKTAKDAYRQYIGITGKGSTKDKAQKTVNKILGDLTNPGFEADKVVSMFFGHSNFNPSPVMATVLQRLQANIPKEKFTDIVGLVKDAVLEKAFSGNGKSGITRNNIVNNYNQIFNKNRKLINLLFNKNEINKIIQFRKDVAPTLWADPNFKANTSGTTYTMVSTMARAGLLKSVNIPFIQQSVESLSNTNAAYDAIKNYVTRSRQPLFDIPLPNLGQILRGDLNPRNFEGKGFASEIQGITTGAKDVIMGTEEVDTTAIKNLADGLSSEARAKLIEIYQN
jgi:hypothetical protein